MQQGVGGGMDGQMGDSNKVAYYFMYGVKYGHYLGKGRTRAGGFLTIAWCFHS